MSVTDIVRSQSEDTAPAPRRVFHKGSNHHAKDAVTFDHQDQRIELELDDHTFTIARYTPGAEHDTIEKMVLPRSVAPLFMHPEVQELLLKA